MHLFRYASPVCDTHIAFFGAFLQGHLLLRWIPSHLLCPHPLCVKYVVQFEVELQNGFKTSDLHRGFLQEEQSKTIDNPRQYFWSTPASRQTT